MALKRCTTNLTNVGKTALLLSGGASLGMYHFGVLQVTSLLFFFIALGLELSDTKVYEPEIRALLGNASRFCEASAKQLYLDWKLYRTAQLSV